MVSILLVFLFSIYASALGFDNTLELLLAEKQKYPSWYIGKNIFSSNYLYHICDYSIKSTLNYATPCYQVQLDFIALLQEQSKQSWIVQAIFTPDNTHKNWFAILHISDDFATITTDGTSMNYAASLSHTLFYLQKYANIHKPQSLEIGTSWGSVNEYVSPVPSLVVNRFTTSNIGNTPLSFYQVGFEVSTYNAFYIQEKIPFPIESILYDSKSPDTSPRVLYQVKLLSASNATKTAIVGPQLDLLQTCSLSQEQTTPANNVTQPTLKNNAGDMTPNYTNEINFTNEDKVLQGLKKLNGSFTLSSTR